MSILAGKNSIKMKIRDVENVFRHRRIPYPKRSVELIALIAISCTFFLFMHTKNLNTRLREMEVKLQPSELSALGLTGEHHLSGGASENSNDINTLHGTYQYLKSTGQFDELDALKLNNTNKSQRDVLLFNRVPKVGSEQLIELLRHLSQDNHFSATRASFSTPIHSRLSDLEQLSMATAIDNIPNSSSYSRHENYINFTKFDLPKPIYINLVRDPVERVISWFYYRRAPWTAVLMYKASNGFRKPSWYRKNYAQCVLSGNKECSYIQDAGFKSEIVDHRRQSLFFCGHNPVCEPFNSEGALQLAKRNVENEYAVVGSWEDTNVTLTVLEHYIPRFFKGALNMYYDKAGLGRTLQNSNPWKAKIGNDIKKIVRKNFTKEIEFYNFCKQRLYKQFYALEASKLLSKAPN